MLTRLKRLFRRDESAIHTLVTSLATWPAVTSGLSSPPSSSPLRQSATMGRGDMSNEEAAHPTVAFLHSTLDEQDKRELQAWRDVFGHLGTPDEVGNIWIALRDEHEHMASVLRACVALYQCRYDDPDLIKRGALMEIKSDNYIDWAEQTLEKIAPSGFSPA